METKVPRIHAERIRVTLGYEGLFYVDNDGLSGGMALLWKKNNTVRFLSYSQSHIDAEVSLFNKLWRMTCIYGIPERGRREETWDLLGTLKTRSLLPWVVIGDFNNLLYQHEKKGGNPYPNSLLRGFGDALDDCGLMQMPMRGHQYTWQKGKGTPNWIEERLDKALITNDWGLLNENAMLENIRTRASDHSILFLSINAICMPRRRGPRKFRFEMAWLLDEGCKGVVETAWQEGRTEGLLHCQQLCGEKLMRWGGDQFHKFGKRINHLQRRQDAIRNRRDLVALAEYQQIENTMKRNYFENIFASNELSCNDPLFGVLTPRVTLEQNVMLDRPFETNEVKETLFSMYPDKAPGPDGLNPGFYQQFWGIVGGDVSGFVINALNSCVFPEGLNDTNIVLIPKKEMPETVADLRPIALSNVIYRIMAKMIANRMKTLMGGLISESQSAFIPGRLITDNILVAAEVGHYLNRKQCGIVGWSALKLDMSKAYDRMEWNFLERMLTVMGFSEKWEAGVIRQCLARYEKLSGQAWRFLTDPETLVAKIYKARYYPTTSFTDATIDSFTTWLKGVMTVLTEEQIRLMVVILYYIWRTRNSAVWKGSMMRPTRLVRAATVALQAYGTAHVGRTNPTPATDHVNGSGGGGLRCYVDAGFRHDTGEATYGMVIIVPDGSFVAARNGKLPICFSPLMAEAQAYKEALSWLLERDTTSAG
ncbi:PREDICTED: uncharacterized protein LOC109169860 [Ipomoea nil]|uniref:uncharacterized protein LOC109169860 n=1 Tax=Ipomoea nil TaxID=35883 RepID=UPI000901F108|nr:PREDICTED: uncharacterized protein LOC109169860 [Ipomoea nil]